MTKETLEAQDEVLRQAWKDGALNDAWFNKWIEEVYAEQGAKIISSNLPVSGQFSLAIVKKAFETFHYVGFPHNHPTWEEWAKENLH